MQQTFIAATAIRDANMHAALDCLPVRVRRAYDANDIDGVRRLRASAYARHDYTSHLIGRLEQIDDADLSAVHLIAECKLTGEVRGVLRARSSLECEIQHAPGLNLQEMGGESYTYFDRFAVETGPSAQIIALSLMKAGWILARDNGTEWILAAALRPLARRYARVGLRPLKGAEDGYYMPDMHCEKYYGLGERVADISMAWQRFEPVFAQFTSAPHHRDIVLH